MFFFVHKPKILFRIYISHILANLPLPLTYHAWSVIIFDALYLSFILTLAMAEHSQFFDAVTSFDILSSLHSVFLPISVVQSPPYPIWISSKHSKWMTPRVY